VRADKRWSESEIIGSRLMASEKLTIAEDIAYFDTLVALGESKQAQRYLEGRDRSRQAAELPSFRIQYADKLLQTAPNDPLILNRALALLRQALAGGLNSTNAFLARRLLGSQAYATSNYDAALDFLRPLESESFDIAVEIAWIRWIREIDGDTTAPRSEAKKLLDELIRQTSQRKKFRLVNPTAQELNDIAMLLVILGREKEFLDLTRELIVLSPAEKDRIQFDIDNYRINAELKKKRPDINVVVPIIASRLENTADENNTLYQAILIWSSFPSGVENELTRKVQERLRSDKASTQVLHFAGDMCRDKGNWTKAREVYERILKQAPDDIPALNNLAECYYKVKPFEYEQALRLADRALALAPGIPAIIETRGQILARLGKLDESQSILEECLAAYPKDWNLRNTLAQIYQRKGDTDKAERHRKLMQDLEPPPGSEVFRELP